MSHQRDPPWACVLSFCPLCCLYTKRGAAGPGGGGTAWRCRVTPRSRQSLLPPLRLPILRPWGIGGFQRAACAWRGTRPGAKAQPLPVLEQASLPGSVLHPKKQPRPASCLGPKQQQLGGCLGKASWQAGLPAWAGTQSVRACSHTGCAVPAPHACLYNLFRGSLNSTGPFNTTCASAGALVCVPQARLDCALSHPLSWQALVPWASY